MEPDTTLSSDTFCRIKNMDHKILTFRRLFSPVAYFNPFHIASPNRWILSSNESNGFRHHLLNIASPSPNFENPC